LGTHTHTPTYIHIWLVIVICLCFCRWQNICTVLLSGTRARDWSPVQYLPCLFVWLARRECECECVSTFVIVFVYLIVISLIHTYTLTHKYTNTLGVVPAQADLLLKGDIHSYVSRNCIVYFLWYHEGTNMCKCVSYVFQVRQQLAKWYIQVIFIWYLYIMIIIIIMIQIAYT